MVSYFKRSNEITVRDSNHFFVSFQTITLQNLQVVLLNDYLTAVFFTENLCYNNFQQAHCGADGGFHWVSNSLKTNINIVV